MASQALALFRRFGGSAAGRWLFSRLVAFKAPYFRSIKPTIDVLEPGRCEARIPHRWTVQNHIGTVHAIALCNLAELTAGLIADASIADSDRWIPKGMTVRYLAKASGEMKAVARCEVPGAVSAGRELIVHVEITDPKGTVVLGGEITMWITPRKK